MCKWNESGLQVTLLEINRIEINVTSKEFLKTFPWDLKNVESVTVKSLIEDALLFNFRILERTSIQDFQNFM